MERRASSAPGEEEDGEEVLLSGTFSLAPDPQPNYALSLTKGAQLRVRRLDGASSSSSSSSSSSWSVCLSECVGCQAVQSPGAPQPPPAAFFTLFLYPARRGSCWWDASVSRQRLVRTFGACASREPAENRRLAEKWAHEIRRLAAPRPPPGTGVTYGLLPRPCRVMILLNPQSGSGRAPQLFRCHVQPMLKEANIGFDMFVTERHNHAWDMVKEKDLSRWDALVVMAGDGLLYEVINGLMERPDWRSVIQKPLCILPGGSGNALAASLNHYGGKGSFVKEDLLMNCTFFLCKGLHAPMDLVSLRTASGKRLFSFLSFGWGFVSDVDIASERYRKLGSIRFTVGTFQLLACFQVYKGRVSYLPVEEQNPCTDSSLPPGAQKDTSAQDAAQMLSNNIVSPAVPAHPGQDSVLEDSLLVPLEQPVPQHWTVAPQEEFVSIVAIFQSHLGADLLLAPSAKLYDDAIHLFYLTAGVSRMAMIKFFMAMDKGTHLSFNNPHLHYVPVKAFRVEPFEPKGVMTVDGEVLACEPVQGQIHRRLARIITGS
ncbi:sphingosine kinase 1 [Anolis sagrei]|uniref:sphingosine kinase 1 n=1 Tax=Anolis sagrei TaxID=38937 RepID=UPI00352039CC